MKRWLKVVLILAAFAGLVLLLGLGFHRVFAAGTPGIDLYTFWQAGRSLIFEGMDPYSPEVTRAIQIGIYGHPQGPGVIPMYYAYPPYALIPVLPLLNLTFDWCQSLWLSFCLLALIAAALASLPRARPWMILLIPFLYPFSFGLILGNFAIPIAAVLLVGLARLVLRSDNPSPSEQVLLGLALAWASAKPQFTWFFLLLIVLNALRRKQWPLLGGIAVGGLGSLAFSFIVMPGWPRSWLTQLGNYTRNDPASPPLQDYLGHTGWLVTLATAAILFATVWLLILWWQGKLPTPTLLIWGGAATFLLGPNGRAYEQIPYLIPLLLWAGNGRRSPLHAALTLTLLVPLTWLLFYLSHNGYPLAADRWMFALFLAWAASLWALERRAFPSPAGLTP